ncbi:galactose-1-phosphate uridyl transferase [Rhexocercosporidium sp. MPI-PUGE-AT-0058]|nr:galactose-1-phosphate uridyl transferase [Rhexocercosporidium sp. MPI-PUGE-AT-0058]
MVVTKLNDIAHRRFNPLSDSWVLLVSPHKLKRPRQGQKEVVTSSGRAHDPECYLCPRNFRAKGDRNPNYTGTFIFESDFNIVRMDEGEYEEEVRKEDPMHGIAFELLRAQPVIGRCYVLTYSPNHHYKMSNMTRQEVLGIVEAWTRVYAKHLCLNNPLRISSTKIESLDPKFEDAPCLNIADLKYMQIFDNNGEIVGCSNLHPHGQIWITSSMPDEPRVESAQMCKYRQEHGGRHLLGDYVQLELDREERIV